MVNAASFALALIAVLAARHAEGARHRSELENELLKPALRVVHINDVYSLDNMAKLKTLVKEARKGAEKTLFTVGGDFLAPYLLSTFDKGAGMVKCLSKIGVDFVIFGNHECDVGEEELNNRVKEMTSAGTLWLNSNMPDFYNNSGISTLGVSPAALPPFADLVVGPEGSEKKIRILGVMTDEIDTMSGGAKAFSGAAGTMTDPVETVISMTKEADVDFVLPLVHLYLDPRKRDTEPTDKRLGQAIEKAGPDVRKKIIAILGSHDHPKEGMHEYLAGDLQLLKGAMDASHAAVLDVYFVDGQPQVNAKIEPVASYGPDEEMLASVADAEAAVEPVKSMVLSESHIQEMFPGGNVSWPLSSQGVRERPSNMASFMASLHTRAAKCDFSLLGGGAIRANQVISSGGISVKQILSELPFNNPFTCLPVPGYMVADSVHQTRDIVPGTKNAAYSHADLSVEIEGSGRDYHVTGFSRHEEGTENWIPEAFNYQQEMLSEDVVKFKEALGAKRLITKDLTENAFPEMKIYHVGQIMGVPPEDSHVRQLYDKVQDWWPSKDAGLPQHTIIFGFFEEWLKSHIFKLMTDKLQTVIKTMHSMSGNMASAADSGQYDASDEANKGLADLLETLLHHVEQLHAKDVSLLTNFDSLAKASESPLMAATGDQKLHESAKQLLDTVQAYFTIQKILKKDMSMELKSVQLRHPMLQSFLEIGEGSAAAVFASAQQRLQYESKKAVSTIFQAGLLKQFAEDGNLLDHLVQSAESYVQALAFSRSR
mmetsp:Transcript_50823/g.91335  ORF Transcript_50823/g.91335 Transcript_50823/m.91335 type:complete len:769 (-) Transcript_50823:73-2379(-)